MTRLHDVIRIAFHRVACILVVLQSFWASTDFRLELILLLGFNLDLFIYLLNPRIVCGQASVFGIGSHPGFSFLPKFINLCSSAFGLNFVPGGLAGLF